MTWRSRRRIWTESLSCVGWASRLRRSLAACARAAAGACISSLSCRPARCHATGRVTSRQASTYEVRLTSGVTAATPTRTARRGLSSARRIVSGGYIIAAGAKNSQGGRYIFEHGDYTTAAEAPRELLFLAIFNSRERRMISADADLKQRIDRARPDELVFIYADRQRELGAFRRGRKQEAKAAGYTAPIGSIYATPCAPSRTRSAKFAGQPKARGTKQPSAPPAACSSW